MSNPVRILLIDDNPVDRTRILRELEQDFPDLQTVEVSEESGFAKAMESADFDLVLCDYALPWTNGLALLQIIKTRWPAAPVIMVTGSRNDAIAIGAIKAGLDDYTLKSARGSPEDITERKRAEVALTQRMRQIEAIRPATLEITRELDLPTLLELISRRAVELVDAASGGVWLWDDAVQGMAPAAWFGEERPVTGDAWRLVEGIVGTVAERRQGMVVGDYATSPCAPPAGSPSVPAAALMAEPLVCGDKLLGVLAIASAAAGRRFGEDDRHILGLFAAQAAVAVENARLFGQVSQAKQEWETTFNAAADMIAVMDAQCRVVRVNHALATHLGADPTAVIGRRCDEVFPWRTGPSGDEAFARCVASGQPVTEEREHPGTGRVFLQTYSPFVDAQGRPLGVIQVSKDVTAQRQLQQRLSHSEKMAAMGRLISGVAHELNNPLTAVFGNAQLLMLGATDEITRQRAGVLVAEADRAATIVRNLLAFARPYKPERRPLLLDQLIDEAVNLRKRDLSARKITVLHSRETAIPPVLADPHQIRQVVGNLFTNAEQALSGRGGGEIRIACRAEPEEDSVKVAVSDNGPGIPPEVLDKVFDPFLTTKEAGKGTGLDLAICYAILREHGGQIRAGNRREGGAWFEFELPVAAGSVSAPPGEPAASGADVPPRGRGTARKRILVVDDEESIVRVVAGALGIVGHHVEVAKDGRAAADVLTRGEFDLVLMDMKMPGFDGERVYEDVIRRKATPPRVIIMTGDTVNKQTRRFLDRTGLRCVEKPFKLQDIWDCVRDDGPASPAPSDPKASTTRTP